MIKEDTEVHAYDANLDEKSDVQAFFEKESLSVATRFFRNKELFKELRNNVLPHLIAGGLGKRRVLRVWSAGCSDGRETYSLALAVRRFLDDSGHQGIDLYVRGSDVSRAQIALADKGEYRLSEHDVQNLEPYRDSFEVLDRNLWRIKSLFRGKIDFVVEDITKATPAEPYDILVCSLVILYYEESYQKEIIKQLSTTVRRGGALHVVPINRRWMHRQGFNAVSMAGHFFYVN